MQTRSRTLEMPSGLSLPLAFGIYTRSRWAYSSLKITHPCQPSPIPLSCRPAHRPFRDLLGVHSRCGLHTRAVTVFRDRYPGVSDISSPPCLPRLLPAGAVAGWALHPLKSAALSRQHTTLKRADDTNVINFLLKLLQRSYP